MRKKLGIQGGRGSFHEMAAEKLYGKAVELEYILTFEKLFQLMEKGDIEKCAVAIANNAVGFIHEPYALLTSERAQQFWISGETYVRVEHQLLGMPGSKLSQIKEIHSQAPAISQCSDFLHSNLPEAVIVEQEDTAQSAELVKQWQDPTKAAIASKKASKLNGLEILDENIQDDPENITRFIVLERRTDSNKFTKGNKFSAILHTPQTPGSLLKALEIFYRANINLSTLHSAFIPNSAFEMKFFIEFEDEERLPEHFADNLKSIGCNLELLGSYRSAEIPINGRDKA